IGFVPAGVIMMLANSSGGEPNSAQPSLYVLVIVMFPPVLVAVRVVVPLVMVQGTFDLSAVSLQPTKAPVPTQVDVVGLNSVISALSGPLTVALTVVSQPKVPAPLTSNLR